MRRTDRFTHLVSLLLFLGLMAYLGAWAFGALETRLRTVQVSRASLSRGFEARGLIIREEMPLSLPEDCLVLAQSGLRLGAGDVIAELRGAALTAEKSGLFAPCDGFESLSPAVLDSLGPEALEELLGSPPSGEGGYKLVRGSSWYFAALVPRAAASELAPGDRVTLELGLSAEAEVLRISEESQGQCAIIFRCGQAMAETLGLRMAEVTVSLGRLEGLRLPAAALLEDEAGGFYVRVLTATLTEEKSVTVLHREDDWVLAAIEDRPDALREGNTVILDNEV